MTIKINQILLIYFALLSAVWCLDPGTRIKSYGFRVDVSRMISKIARTLDIPQTKGIPIGVKQGAYCLDGGYILNGSQLNPSPQCPGCGYSVTSTTCDSAKTSQKWRLNEGQMKSWIRSPEGVEGGLVCLDCTSSAENCYLEPKRCNTSRIQQQFYIRVHPSQLDLMTSRVYFSIHSGAHRRQCLTSYWSSEKGGLTYALQSCSGADEQSFYIAQDYSTEIETASRIVRPCATTNF